MKTIKGNILNIDTGIICHQVNCKGVMGKGLAGQIRDKWPGVYSIYKTAWREGKVKLGNVIYAPTYDINTQLPFVAVASLCGQDGYGYNGMYTDYNALENCLSKVAAFNEASAHPYGDTYIPKGMSCGLAGGKWEIVEELIERWLPYAIIVQVSNTKRMCPTCRYFNFNWESHWCEKGHKRTITSLQIGDYYSPGACIDEEPLDQTYQSGGTG